MQPTDHIFADVADAILDGVAINWADVEMHAGADRALLDRLKVLAALANVHRGVSPRLRWGHLELIEPLGRGAFGQVFRARDTRLDREVALKLLDTTSPSGDARASAIVEEGRLLAQVRHPNVVTIYGAERIGHELGLWMERVDGCTLDQLLDRGKPLTAVEVVDIGGQLCDAVAAVHDARLLHRDIKAANVMRSERGRVVLMDFGTGWEADGSSSAVLAGTPLYLAPELLEGAAPTIRTDIYAVGVLLFLLLTRRYPVSGHDIDDLKQAHRQGQRIGVRTLRSDVPAALGAVIERSIAPAAAQRYESATAMGAALRLAIRPRSRWMVGAATIAAFGAAVLIAAQAWSPGVRSTAAAPAQLPLTPAILPVTSASGEKRHPALSADAGRVAYSWNRDGVWQIYVTELGSLRTWQAPGMDEDGIYPRWSPDGRSLAFYRGFRSHAGPQTVVRHVSLDGGGPSTLWQTSAQLVGDGLSWSPDGRYLALSIRPAIGQPLQIMLLEVMTRARRWLTNPVAVAGDALPAFSPDGASLAFVRSTGSQSAIHVVELETGELRHVAAGQHHIGDMTWNDEGRSLIFTSLHAGGRDRLWRVASAGGDPQPIAGVGEGAKSPSAGANGRLVYLQQLLESNIYRVDLAGGLAAVPQQLAPSTRVESSPDISPDGSQIAFTSNRSGSNEVWIADASGTNPRQLTALASTAHPRWSPDGRQLAVVVKSSASAASIHVVDASSGASRRLTSGTTQERWPTWSSDGASIYYAANTSGSWQIWKIPAAGGEPVQVTHNGGLKVWASSDGSFLYYSSEWAKQSGVWRMPLSGGAPTLVLRFPPDTPWGGEWIVRPEGIYWLNVGASPQVIELLSFATGRSAPVILPNARYDHGSGFSVSNDGQWALFSQMDYLGTDIMQVEMTPSLVRR